MTLPLKHMIHENLNFHWDFPAPKPLTPSRDAVTCRRWLPYGQQKPSVHHHAVGHHKVHYRGFEKNGGPQNHSNNRHLSSGHLEKSLNPLQYMTEHSHWTINPYKSVIFQQAMVEYRKVVIFMEKCHDLAGPNSDQQSQHKNCCIPSESEPCCRLNSMISR